MKTATPPFRAIARGSLVSLVCGAATALAILAMAFSSIAGAAAPDSPTPIAELAINGGHDDLGDLGNDPGMALLSEIVCERQTRAGGDPLDMEALALELGRHFESTDTPADSIVYELVIFEGIEFIVCKLKEAIVITDPLLDGPSTVSQTTTVRID